VGVLCGLCAGENSLALVTATRQPPSPGGLAWVSCAVCVPGLVRPFSPMDYPKRKAGDISSPASAVYINRSFLPTFPE